MPRTVSRRAAHRLFAALAIACAACRGANEPPPCSAVAGNFVLLAEQNLAKVGELDATTRRNVHDQLPAMRDSLDRACRESSWSGAVRTCLATAADHVAFQACETQLTDEQRQLLANPPSD